MLLLLELLQLAFMSGVGPNWLPYLELLHLSPTTRAALAGLYFWMGSSWLPLLELLQLASTSGATEERTLAEKMFSALGRKCWGGSMKIVGKSFVGDVHTPLQPFS